MTVWIPLNTKMCSCPPDMSSVYATGQLHNPDCPLNPAKKCAHCKGTGLEPKS
jgi:hypothetical protein